MKILLLPLVAILIALQSLLSQSQSFTINGKVYGDDGLPLPYSSVRVEGTTIGTVSDGEGNYSIVLNSGRYQFRFTYIGYESQRVNVILDEDRVMNIVLKQNTVTLQEVIVEGEDPAYPIIRMTIERKQKIRSNYSTFSANVYTKTSVGGDSSLAFVSEAYSTIYAVRGEAVKEIVVHRRQTANVIDQLQFAMVQTFINFYDDSVSESGYTFISPIANNAFDHYRYRLIASKQSGTRTLHEIEIIPVTNTAPLFSGRIIVDDSAYLMVRVQLEPNEIFQLPFYKIHRYQITQQYSLYKDHYWMPLDYHIAGSYGFRLMWLTNDSVRVAYKKTVICYEYQFDRIGSDSVSTLPNQSALRSDRSKNEEEWKAVSLFPLSKLEEQTYKRFDSIVKMRPSFSPELALNILRIDSITGHFDIRYNRVEGIFFGGKDRHYFTPAWRITGRLGVGIADKEIKYSLSSEYSLVADHTLWFGATAFRLTGYMPMNHEYSSLLNSFSAFFGAEDSYDYYIRSGSTIYALLDISKHVSISSGIIRQSERSVFKNTDFSIQKLIRGGHQRTNPLIDEEWNASYYLDVKTEQPDPIRMFQPPSSSYRLWAEFSDPKIGSGRKYSIVHGTASVRLYPMGQTRLFDPYIGIAVSAGASDGDVPIQRIFSFETPISKIVTPSTLRTIRRNEFTGDQYLLMSIEPNFRNIPFLKMGLAHLSYDVLFRLSYGVIRNNVPALVGRVFPLNGSYREYSLGVGRIMEFFRFDVTYSDYQGGRFALTLNSVL